MGKEQIVKKKKVKSKSAPGKKYGNKFAEKRKGQRPNEYSLARAEKRKQIGETKNQQKMEKAKKKEEEKAQKVN